MCSMENYTFESRYLGTRGIHLPVQAQINRVPMVNGANALPFYTTAPSQATLNGLTTSLNKINAAYAAGSYLDPAYKARGLHGHHHLATSPGAIRPITGGPTS